MLPTLTGKPLTTIAKLVSIAPSTLTRPAKEGDRGTSTLHATTIDKIVTYFERQGVSVPRPEGDRSVVASVLRWALAGPTNDEAAPFDISSQTPLAATARAMIAGRNDMLCVLLASRSLEAAGYLQGDLLICDLNAEASPGDVVRVEVYDRSGSIEETVWRLYDTPYLVGFARDPAQMPKPLTEVPGRVVVKGVVTGMIRPHRLRAA